MSLYSGSRWQRSGPPTARWTRSLTTAGPGLRSTRWRWARSLAVSLAVEQRKFPWLDHHVGLRRKSGRRASGLSSTSATTAPAPARRAASRTARDTPMTPSWLTSETPAALIAANSPQGSGADSPATTASANSRSASPGCDPGVAITTQVAPSARLASPPWPSAARLSRDRSFGKPGPAIDGAVGGPAAGGIGVFCVRHA